jgi:hypothetical protein
MAISNGALLTLMLLLPAIRKNRHDSHLPSSILKIAQKLRYLNKQCMLRDPHPFTSLLPGPTAYDL